jgi:hypothetical protein
VEVRDPPGLDFTRPVETGGPPTNGMIVGSVQFPSAKVGIAVGVGRVICRAGTLSSPGTIFLEPGSGLEVFSFQGFSQTHPPLEPGARRKNQRTRAAGSLRWSDAILHPAAGR